MQLTRQVFTELAEATALWWDVTERRDPDDARRATRQIIAVYRKHQAIITAVNELASYDSVVAENYKAMSDGISERGKAALEHAIAAGGVAPAHLRDGLRADVDA